MSFFNILFFGKINIYGIDLSMYQLEQLRNKFPNYNVKCANMTNIPYENDKFNLVTAFTSFMFLKTDEDISKTFKEVNRVLQNGGYLLIEDAYKKEGHFKGSELIDNGFAGYNINELDKYAKKNGFEKISFRAIFKRLFWSKRSRLNTASLSEYIGYKLTYLFELFLPGEMNNFIILYKKVS